MENLLVDGMLGLAIGDAMGIPVEGCTRAQLKANPITGYMAGGELHGVKAGTWSDITATAMATLVSLVECMEPDGTYENYNDLMNRFLVWKMNDGYSAHEEVFRIDPELAESIERFSDGEVPTACGKGEETDFEHDSPAALVRLFPYAFYQENKFGNYEIRELTDVEMHRLHEMAGLTNACRASKLACGIYSSFIREVLMGINPPREAILKGIGIAFEYYDSLPEYSEVLKAFSNLRNIGEDLPEDVIATGYSSTDVLTAAVWCVLKSCGNDTEQPFVDSVLRAINLGGNTPAVAALTGSIAGCVWGYDKIPEDWKEGLARRVWIEDVCRTFLEGKPREDATALEEEMGYQ